MTVSSERITSRQNRLVVETWKLRDKKERMAGRRFRLDGIKLFCEAVEKGVEILYVLIAESKAERILPLLEKCREQQAVQNTKAYILADDVFGKISEEQAPEGIVAVASFPPFHLTENGGAESLCTIAQDGKSILLLESVRDPGNVGTILRSAAAFGVDCVVMSKDCADIYNAKTVRGAMGALFRMRILLVDRVDDAVLLLRKNGRRVFAAALDPEAKKLTSSALSRGDCVVIGNEGHGLSHETIVACDGSLYIPMEPGSESLNAAIAASVILWGMYSD